MIACFPAHRHLCYLKLLRNTAEVDVDFFENVTHMQIHRRQRAFHKLIQDLQSEKVSCYLYQSSCIHILYKIQKFHGFKNLLYLF